MKLLDSLHSVLGIAPAAGACSLIVQNYCIIILCCNWAVFDYNSGALLHIFLVGNQLYGLYLNSQDRQGVMMRMMSQKNIGIFTYKQ